MSWPTPQDYNEAIQNPRLCFADAELQSGAPELTALGLPRPITGGFASVYQVRTQSRSWAVRCFLRDFADHQERYAAIGSCLAGLKLPYTVGFDFLPNGIRVRGKWYPILKMEWIDGTSLHSAIEANINNPGAMLNLAERWIAMLRAMKNSGMAHGDLQHGNILVSNGDFRLIDYDGMFVPKLAGRSSHEVGHRNYQHPGRTERDFGPQLDNFSGWVIYLTFVALSVDRSLWARFGSGEEHLLFKKDDFEEPRYSRTFRAIENLRDDRIQKYVPLLKSMLKMPVSSLPSAAEALAAAARPRAMSRQPVFPAWGADDVEKRAQVRHSVPRQRIAEPVQARNARREQFELPLPAASELSAEAQPEREPINLVGFSDSFKGERVGVSAYTLLVAALIAVATGGGMPAADVFAVLATGLACLGMFLTTCYATCPEVQDKFRAWMLKELRLNEQFAALQVLAGLGLMHSWLDAAEKRRLVQIEAAVHRRITREKDRIAIVKRSLQAWLDDLEARQQALELAAVQEPQARLAAMQIRRNQEIAQLREITRTVYLNMRPRDARTFRKWENRLRYLVQHAPPQAIPASEMAEIQASCRLEAESLRGCVAFVRLGAKKKIKRIRRRRSQHRAELRVRVERTQLRFGHGKQKLEGAINSAGTWVDRNREELTKHLHEFSRYEEVHFARFLQHVVVGQRKPSAKAKSPILS